MPHRVWAARWPHAFSGEGARVYFCGLEESDGERLVDEIVSAGSTAIYVPADVRSDDDVQLLLALVNDREGRLDIAVNNAAILGAYQETGSHAIDNWNDVMATNAFGVNRCMHHEIPVMIASGGGVIINVGTTNVRDPLPGTVVYAASKAAVHAMTQLTAAEIGAQGIRVTALLPGYMQGGMTDLYLRQSGRSADDFPSVAPYDEVARDALWLASEEAADTHGDLMTRDGIAQRR